MNNALVKVTEMKLKSTELKANLLSMKEADSSEFNATWLFARSLANIINNDMFVEDFEKKGKFAEAVGLSGGRISQCVGAVKFVEKHEQFKKLISVENAYLVGSISVKENGKKVNKTEDFLDALDSKNVKLETLTTKALKELIKKYKDAYGSEVVDAEAETAEAETAEAETAEAETTETGIPMLFAVGYAEETGQYIFKDKSGCQLVATEPMAILTAIADFLEIDLVKKLLEDPKQEDPKQEDPKQEDPKQEEPKQEESKKTTRKARARK